MNIESVPRMVHVKDKRLSIEPEDAKKEFQNVKEGDVKAKSKIVAKPSKINHKDVLKGINSVLAPIVVDEDVKCT